MNKFHVNEEISLIDFLLQTYNKKKAKNLLKYQQVQVNQQTISQFNYLLKPGDEVIVAKSATNLPFEIIYEDKQLIVINKPAGLLSMATSTKKEKTAYHF